MNGTVTGVQGLVFEEGSVTLNGGTLTLGASATLETGTNSVTISSTIAGSGFGLEKSLLSGAGTLTLSGSTSNTNLAMTVSGGTLVLAKDSARAIDTVGTGLTIYTTATVKLGGSGSDQISNQSDVLIAGGLLDLAGLPENINGLSGTGTVTNSSASSSVALGVGASNGSSTFSGVIQDGASQLSLGKMGTGTLILSGSNTYTGSTAVSAGTLRLGANNVIADTSAVNTVLSGVFDVNGMTDTIGSLATVFFVWSGSS